MLETFVCQYAENLGNYDFTPYLNRNELFAIRLKETDKLIGIILHFDDTGGSCEIGFGIGSGYWNQEYTTEAVERFLQYCFEDKGFYLTTEPHGILGMDPSAQQLMLRDNRSHPYIMIFYRNILTQHFPET